MDIKLFRFMIVDIMQFFLLWNSECDSFHVPHTVFHNFINIFSSISKMLMYFLHFNLVFFYVTSIFRTTFSSIIWNQNDHLDDLKFRIEDLVILELKEREINETVKESASTWTITIIQLSIWVSINKEIIT